MKTKWTRFAQYIRPIKNRQPIAPSRVTRCPESPHAFRRLLSSAGASRVEGGYQGVAPGVVAMILILGESAPSLGCRAQTPSPLGPIRDPAPGDLLPVGPGGEPQEVRGAAGDLAV